MKLPTRILTRGLAATLLIMSLAVCAGAQQGSWDDLNARVDAFYHQGKFTEAVSAARELLRFAEANYGADDSQRGGVPE